MPGQGNPLNIPFFRDTVEGDKIAGNIGAGEDTGPPVGANPSNSIIGKVAPALSAFPPVDNADKFYYDVLTDLWYDVQAGRSGLEWTLISQSQSVTTVGISTTPQTLIHNLGTTFVGITVYDNDSSSPTFLQPVDPALWTYQANAVNQGTLTFPAGLPFGPGLGLALVIKGA